MLDQLLKPLRQMQIDMTEFAAFKAIFFLNPDADDVTTFSKTQLSEGRSSITNALYRYMLKKKGSEEAGDSREESNSLISNPDPVCGSETSADNKWMIVTTSILVTDIEFEQCSCDTISC
uniref:NR LBD domain-containing protein n=1 Tax=Heterorhabditis bacteriophora TaxID=37862 RepID=A0A1I7XKD3_HETBA